MSASFEIGLNAVVLAVTDESPRVLTVRDRAGEWALPFGPLDPESERTLELALRQRVGELTGLHLGYVEQLYTFGDRGRDPAVRRAGARPISIGYLALVREGQAAAGASWEDVYRFLPWEDRRQPVAGDAHERVVGELRRWTGTAVAAAAAAERNERVQIAFGLDGSPWDGDRVLERLELLYEAGLVDEATRDHEGRNSAASPSGRPGQPMALDHRRMLATALGRLRGKIRYRPLVFELLPESFTLLQLQKTVEALAGLRLHKANFRRLVERTGLVVGTGRQASTGGRPAERFQFRREVMRERRAPGVGLPRVAPPEFP